MLRRHIWETCLSTSDNLKSMKYSDNLRALVSGELVYQHAFVTVQIGRTEASRRGTWCDIRAIGLGGVLQHPVLMKPHACQ